jgi:hypothetical protein
VPEKQDKSRQQQLIDAGNEIKLPEVTATYLLQYLFEIGPTFPGALGYVGLPFSEIASWQEQTGIELQPWEVRAIRSASIAYANQLSISHDPACPSPISVVEPDPEKLAKHIKSVLR